MSVRCSSHRVRIPASRQGDDGASAVCCDDCRIPGERVHSLDMSEVRMACFWEAIDRQVDD